VKHKIGTRYSVDNNTRHNSNNHNSNTSEILIRDLYGSTSRSIQRRTIFELRC